jgi:cytochrome c biogenesis protein CcmG/thiol:disulfide interchange protein DsbE
MIPRSALILTAVIAVLGLLAYGLTRKGSSALAVGDKAPDATFEKLEGEGTGRIAHYQGSWVLVNFWASWCEPCRAEAPLLERFWRQNRARLVVLGVDLDDASDDARDFVREFSLTYPQLRAGDGSDLRRDYGMTGFPESFLIDPEGVVAAIRRGPVDRTFLAEQVTAQLDAEEQR